jgi:hypothetical protein
MKTETTALAIIAPGFRILEIASLLFKLASGARCAVGADKLVDSLDRDALRLVYYYCSRLSWRW